MEPKYALPDVFRGASVLTVVLLTVALAALLPSPGYGTSRLALFAVIAVFGWVGAAGAVLGRTRLLLAGAVGQFLLGFWNVTVGLFMLPTGAVLLATAVLLQNESTP